MLFAEKEPGKPLNGGFTFVVLVAIILVNLFIFIIIRILLNLENDMDQPYIDGPFRTFLQYFLLYFSLSICFGCWCCCCGGGFLFATLRKIKFCHIKQNDALHFPAIHRLYNRISHVKPNTDFVKKFRKKNDNNNSNYEENGNNLNVTSLQEIIIDDKNKNDNFQK